MTRDARSISELRMLLRLLRSCPAEGLDERLAMLAELRSRWSENGGAIDRLLIAELRRLDAGLAAANELQGQLKEMLDKQARPPLHAALFIEAASTPEWGSMAVVSLQGARTILPVADDFDAGTLAPGDEVVLSRERNIVVGRSPFRTLRCGETALFERFENGRAIVRSRDEEIVVDVAGALREGRLDRGDRVRFDRGALIALERIERTGGDELFLEEAPDERFENIGGLDEQIGELKDAFHLHLFEPKLVEKYRLKPKRSVLLVGGPGMGKTMMARALAAWLGELAGGRPRFMHVKPGELHTMWYAESERRYREAFRAAREAAERQPDVPVVMFFDEIDSIASVRGESATRVGDRVLNAFMVELDGLDRRGNVVVVAATNRAEALDSAVTRPGRLSDLVIEVPRPNRGATAAILDRHLDPAAPYVADGLDSAAAREELIDGVVSRLHAANGDGQVARLTLRDGKERIVHTRDLLSGAMLAGIAADATERAGHRERSMGVEGVRREDLLAAVDAHVSAAVRLLHPGNCSRYLSDLPHDADVVRIERTRRARARVHRVLALDDLEVCA